MLESHRDGQHHERLLSIHHDDREGEGWMISYMDIMTLLVALFVLLLTVSGQVGVLAGAVRGALAADIATQRAPEPVATSVADDAIAVAKTLVPPPMTHRLPSSALNFRISTLFEPVALRRDALAAAQRVSRQSLIVPTTGLTPAIHPLALYGALAVADASWISRTAQTVAIGIAGEGQLKTPQEPLPLIDGVEVSRVKGGINLRIQDHLLFGSGDAELTDPGQDVVQGLVALLDQYQGTISVEGHTDSVPIHTDRYPSNWELSSARATAILRYLVASGIDSGRLRSVGYADTQPLKPNSTVRGRAANRRVELIIHAPHAS